MNRTFSQYIMRKLLLTGLCIFVLVGGILGASCSALAVQLPPGDYSSVKERIIPTSEDHYSPYAGRDFPQQVFWGDLHLHTGYSFDAATRGTLLGPEAGYRFARGEEIELETGQHVKLSRPLDFLAITDHSDGLGAFEQFLRKTNVELLKSCRQEYIKVKLWQQALKGDNEEAKAQASNEIVTAFGSNNAPECMEPTAEDLSDAWTKEIQFAEEYNDPGNFTAIIGYEWTLLPEGNNLHRNVLFRDNGDKASLVIPFTTSECSIGDEECEDPEFLWDWMERYEANQGGQVLAIPHNGNVSNGLMFDTEIHDQSMEESYAQRRQLWEPLYEVTQTKGTSETHPLLSPTDEFADFEVAGWDNGNLHLSAGKPEDEEERKEMYSKEYARSALKNGLKLEEGLGTNPFQFGLIGSSDSHIAVSAVEENNYFGKSLYEAPSPDRGLKVYKFNEDTGLERLQWSTSASGYVGIWAHENTRESLFDAMKRREVYATSGPRMVVRFFGGWNFIPSDVSRNPADVGYGKGVPMGDMLNNAPRQGLGTLSALVKKPTFLVTAMKDPIGANLDRIQIVKGWLDADGETHEQVYDVVWSGNRYIGADGKLMPVGNTVNTDTAEWTNSIGAAELAQVWTDRDFDPAQRAFYYARVLEIPTPRWTGYDKAFYGDAWCGEAKEEDPTACDDIPLILQERVYTSPIWYSPA